MHASLPRWRGRAREGAFGSHPVDPHQTGDVLEFLLAHILKGEIELAGRVLLNARRYADAAWLGQGLEARCDVDAVAKDVAILDHNVADIDADAELDAAVHR